ncbi:hypothetical protein BP6252_05800 [Coleophoma cylindrospora]|uniref:Uncharacterized protein n=1 Tax=Coleophoma cylindrospora TaxID=1849047 RepID=A0A3D8RUJ8_9HELO|nr:hypothetical protein BP6252_05800 [Coleophoma cylindrospora]
MAILHRAGRCPDLVHIRRDRNISKFDIYCWGFSKTFWDYVFGGRTIHIRYAGSERYRDGGGPWDSTYVECDEPGICKQSYVADSDTTKDRAGSDAHEACNEYFTFYSVQRILGLGNLNRNLNGASRKHTLLAPLLVCKQIYAEGSPIFWGQTIWSFCTSAGFLSFMKTRSCETGRLIKKIHISIDTGNRPERWYGPNASKEYLSAAPFTGLHVLYLDIRGGKSNNGLTWNFPFEFYHGETMLFDRRAGRYSIDLTDLCSLRFKEVKLNLTETVRVDGTEMSQDERDRLKEALRARILNNVVDMAENTDAPLPAVERRVTLVH